MKKSTSVISYILGLGLFATPLALSAKSLEQAYVESYRGRSDIPVPISVVMPEVSARYAGQMVELMFTVDATGKPEQLLFREPVERELAEMLTSAVEQWQFAPARVDGRPVARKVLLPLRIVDGMFSAADQALAMK